MTPVAHQVVEQSKKPILADVLDNRCTPDSQDVALTL